MEERMSEKKNMTGKENSFHMENFRRRSRYAAVFLVLILAFAAITVLNINSGNVNISIPEIFRILLRRTGEGERVQYYLENPPSAYSDGGNPGRCSVPVGLPFTDFL